MLLRDTCLGLVFTTVLMGPDSAVAQDPHWLWTSADAKDNDAAFFRKTIELKAAPQKALFVGSCESVFALFVNRRSVVEHCVWEEPLRKDVTRSLKAGKNQIAVRGRLIVCDQYGALYRVFPPPAGQVFNLSTNRRSSYCRGSIPHKRQARIVPLLKGRQLADRAVDLLRRT